MDRIPWHVSILGVRLPVHAYGLMIVVGFLVGLAVAVRRGRTVGLAGHHVYDLSLAAILAGIVGARAFHVLETAGSYDFAFLYRWAGTSPATALAGAALGLAGLAASIGPRGRPGAVLAIPAVLVAGRIVGSPPLEAAALLALAALVWANRAGLRGADRGAPRTALTALAAAAGGAWATTRYVHAELFDWRAVTIWEGGLVFYGGFLAATAVVLTMARRRGIPVLEAADALAPSLALGLAFARLGCFLNGCCWGKPVPAGFPGIRWPAGTLPAAVLPVGPGGASVPVHATQLLSSWFAFGLFLVLSAYFSRRRRRGEVFVLLLALYAIGRFGIEFLRHDTWIARPAEGIPLTTSQYVSLGTFAVAGILLFLSRRLAGEAIESEQKACSSPT